MPRPFALAWLSGVKVHVSSADETLRDLFFKGQFEPCEFHYLDQVLKPGMTFVDVGANLGLYSLFASKKVGPQGSVLALEASAREFSKLQKNILLNRATNVRALRCAAADAVGVAQMKIADEVHAGHNTLGEFIWNTALDAVETVDSCALDQIVFTERLHRLDVIKMDIEGSELAALRGARNTLLRWHPDLLIEVSERTRTDVSQFLADCGYKSVNQIGSLVHYSNSN